MEQFIQSNFNAVMLGDGEEQIEYFQATTDSLVRMSIFLALYGTVEPTYDKLTTAAQEGWQGIFDDWKARGIL